MSIRTNVTVGAGYAGNVLIRVYGTGQVISSPVYRSDGDGFVGTIPEGGTYNKLVNNAPSGPYYIGSRNGIAALTLYNINTSSAGYMWLQYADNGGLTVFTGILVTGITPGDGKVTQIIFPMRPMIVNFQQAAGGSYQGTVTQ